MKKAIRRIIIALIILFVVFCAATYFLTPFFMVHPNSSPDAVEELQSMPNVTEVEMDDGLMGWFIDDASSEDLIIYFGGNSENASSAALRFINNQEYFDGFDIAIVDWPGYGLSKGYADSDSLRSCALAVLDYYSNVEGRIFVFGYSMGTGPAVYCTSRSDAVDGLVLMSPYASAYDLYNNQVNIFYGPFRLLLPFNMNSADYAANVAITPLIITSKSDKLVPYASSIKLSGAFPNGAFVEEFNDLSHSEYWGSEEVLQAIRNYILRRPGP